MLLKIADIIEENLEMLATVETKGTLQRVIHDFHVNPNQLNQITARRFERPWRQTCLCRLTTFATSLGKLNTSRKPPKHHTKKKKTTSHPSHPSSVIRADEGTATEIDANTISICIHEPMGVVGQIIPWQSDYFYPIRFRILFLFCLYFVFCFYEFLIFSFIFFFAF